MVSAWNFSAEHSAIWQLIYLQFHIVASGEIYTLSVEAVLE